ncbi:hypothetical protein BSN82_15790 [Acinetobacter baylyi]|nr:hypothetical protein BSL88_16030 [Acinetobacter baylyi]MAK30798.1 hypothetical protein [Acinetobacter sp.]KAF2370879.1 hypothetical protein BSL67_16550 [Acinetobacter baylyi]KAF2374952.1 hypothetical protein BSN81_16610 [Acinetobacter baylyi]KAF2379202.1 hypothetical protein BSN83_16465 [Acinetobacter baylyi]
MAKVCDLVDQATNQCLQWSILQVSWLDELNQLSRSDINQIITEVVVFWLTCWGYRALLKFIEDRA